MAQPVVYQWPSPDAIAICDAVTTTTLTAVSLPFNGTLGQTPPSTNPINFNGFSRPLALSSTGDLSASTFVINGAYNGFSITENIAAGPNNNTIFTQNRFSSITNISVVGGLASPLNVGTGILTNGIQGVTKWFPLNFYINVLNLGIWTVVQSDVVNYTFECSLDNVNTVQENDLTIFTPIQSMLNATTSQNYSFLEPIMYARIKFNEATNANGQFKVYFMQQGSN